MILYAGGHFSRLCFEEGAGVYADLMRFLVRIRGALTPPPRMDEPVTKMPLGGETGEQTDIAPCTAVVVCVVHAPSCPEDAETYAETYARRCPQVWTCLFKKLSDVERLSRACAHKVQVNNSWPPLRKKRDEFTPVKRR
jgi:hypothetical protein